MPYKVVRRGDQYAVMTIKSGKLHGLTTEDKAKAQMRVMIAAEKGECPTR